jgi:hypothetical protein
VAIGKAESLLETMPERPYMPERTQLWWVMAFATDWSVFLLSLVCSSLIEIFLLIDLLT